MRHVEPSLKLDQGSLVLECDYDADLVAGIKALPYTDRKWDPTRRVWVVDPKHGKAIADLVAKYLGKVIFIPQPGNGRPVPETRVLDVRYIGTCKERGDGTKSAFAWCNRDWSVILPEQVLRDWFMVGESTPDEAPTLYGVLGIARSATPDEIKKAYRRMALQWHPDTCREPGAEEQFKAINHAYQTLSKPDVRAKYDAGLEFERSMERIYQQDRSLYTNYRSPLRCGYILADGLVILGRFIVHKILQWEDIIDNQGRTLVSEWPMGAKSPVEKWV